MNSWHVKDCTVELAEYQLDILKDFLSSPIGGANSWKNWRFVGDPMNAPNEPTTTPQRTSVLDMMLL
ncbi:MAG: hypothetical protein JSS66_07225 [Armatimonadetes bacterium]|nr:hypothetical protein [Armatimonadota bacterium]